MVLAAEAQPTLVHNVSLLIIPSSRREQAAHTEMGKHPPEYRKGCRRLLVELAERGPGKLLEVFPEL